MLSGWILLGIAIGNYFLSRWSEIRLLRKAGCNTTHDYHTRLCVIEKLFMEAKVNLVNEQEVRGNFPDTMRSCRNSNKTCQRLSHHFAQMTFVEALHTNT